MTLVICVKLGYKGHSNKKKNCELGIAGGVKHFFHLSEGGVKLFFLATEGGVRHFLRTFYCYDL